MAQDLSSTPDRPTPRPWLRGRVTRPLVDLLHERQELREIYAPADIIDRAIRDSA